jgi:hypothetical protein
MMELSNRNTTKKTYEKPELELVLFDTEEICSSGILGEMFGMDGISID